MNTLPSDPVMLLSVINMKLRDQYDSLDSLCDDLDVNKEEIINKLSSVNYVYDEAQNQFKQNVSKIRVFTRIFQLIQNNLFHF